MAAYTLRAVSGNEEVLTAYPPLVRRLLLARGITTVEDAERFLRPDWDRDTHDPFLMKDMRKVCERIAAAIAGEETIAIWSDYDMDGIPGAVVLYDLFRKLGYERVIHHTPHRNKDGFGLNRTGLDELQAAGAALVITIDCGITDVEQVAYANEHGLDVIVTDHHIPGEVLPPAYAVLNPKQEGCIYPEKMLCGAGVAFKLAQAVLAHLATEMGPRAVDGGSGGTGSGVPATRSTEAALPPAGWEKWLLDMAGMATIADMVPLVGENRALAHFGLVVLRKSRRLGLQALLKKARADQRHLTEDDIGFTIAPRVNAASRMGHARDAFRLLASTEPAEAGALADELDRINTERKTVVATMKREIKRRLEKMGEPKEVIVLGNPEWKPSLLGLVAGGLAEEYARPVFLWGREEGLIIKGSCRSDGVVSVHEVMRHASEHFIEYGGHAYSGGFSLEQERVHVLEQALIKAHRHVRKDANERERVYDSDLAPDDVTWETHRAVSLLAPFGEGNPKPLFMMRDVLIAGVRQFGKGNEHLELSLARSDGGRVKAIAFFTAYDAYGEPFHEGQLVSLMVHLEASYFRSRPELRVRLVDVV
jgi:single-stranded-DNA-specific exonuclease